MSQAEIEHLRRASAGLLYPSESDCPFEVFVWEEPELTPQHVAAHSGKDKDQKVEEVSIGAFFDELAETQEAQRFHELRRVIESHLRDVKVFRVGDIEIDVFIIGRSPSGHWVGLRTQSVET